VKTVSGCSSNSRNAVTISWRRVVFHAFSDFGRFNYGRGEPRMRCGESSSL
jgi:hypothetical protein